MCEEEHGDPRCGQSHGQHVDGEQRGLPQEAESGQQGKQEERSEDVEVERHNVPQRKNTPPS
ncbi:hypothetical protein F7725_008327 [Dissostichus mawsoni]|uniref:Uncharacterized protein n=1 Tax=Dissostichus mawsoni TaxID=36200 RepID=A0A7J5Y6V7_DISMA|nr:hypothetical protein F7725_008327 [Dissostichus mawsoni]